MPPVSQQSTRGGLIAAVVTFVILTLVFAVMFFTERGKRQRAENDTRTVEDRLKGMLPDAPDQSEPLKAYKEKATRSAGGGADPSGDPAAAQPAAAKPLVADATNAFDLAYGELRKLIELTTGSSAYTPEQARDYILAQRQQAGATANAAPVKPDGVNFTMNPSLIVRQFADAWATLAQQKVAADAATAAEQAKAVAAQKATDEVLKGKDAEVANVQKLLQQKQTDLDNLQKQFTASLEQVKASNVGNVSDLNTQNSAFQQQVAKLSADIAALTKDRNRLVDVLRGFRMDPTDNIVRRPDGTISRVLENGDAVLVNLGNGRGLAVGTTFEVYDARIGIPSLKNDNTALEDESAKRTKNANQRLASAADKGVGGAVGVVPVVTQRYDTQLPEGMKGSIEVISVDANGAYCRVVGKNPGRAITVGDVVANLVYDPNVKFKFAVFGNFDLDYNGVPTTADTATIKRRIEEWGGQVVTVNGVDDIGPEIDFLVVGIAPQVPVLAAEDAQNAVSIQLVDRKKQERDVYNKVLERSREYSIPTLNQTRFLYYTGYFDSRTR